MVDNALQEGQATAVLCSAGLDSAVLLADEARRGPVTPVYVCVGLAWETAERRALEGLLAAPVYATVAPPVTLRLTMRDVYPASHWAIRGEPPAYDTPDEDVYLLGRNVILLAKAGVFCAQRRIPRLVLGSLAGNPFPDATPRFLAGMADALSSGLGHPLAIEAPFRALHKAEVVARGRELDVPLERSLSCMRPLAGTHCGGCSKCRERHDAFLEAGLPDPTLYATPPPRGLRTA
jgi:7-cyano-7-deazaguanine synthase